MGASVKGPSHSAKGLSCQDSWLAVSDSNSSLIAVSDGMGSCCNAKIGSRAAVLAVRDSWRLWQRSPSGSVEDLIKLLEVSWRLRLKKTLPESACATCLVYAEDYSGRAAIAQLGDGIIVRRNSDGKTRVHPSTHLDFGMTHALGTSHTLREWSFELVDALKADESILVATDGISEDLNPSKISSLMEWLTSEVGNCPTPSRSLVSELRKWPVPGHQDDKTIVMIWKKN